jgi:hypothetical protein
MGAVSTRPKDFFTAMKISSEILIDLSTSDSDADSSVLTNVEKLIHLLQTSFSTITHALHPELVFNKTSDTLFECWVFAEDKGFYLQPQMPIMTTADGGLNPYRSAASLVMIQLRAWNSSHPTSEKPLGIPILFR